MKYLFLFKIIQITVSRLVVWNFFECRISVGTSVGPSTKRSGPRLVCNYLNEKEEEEKEEARKRR